MGNKIEKIQEDNFLKEFKNEKIHHQPALELEFLYSSFS